MGTVSVANQDKTIFGTKRICIADVTFSSSYATGGDTLVASDFGLTRFDYISTSYPTDGAEFATWDGDQDAPELLLFTADGTEATNATDQSGVTIKVLAVGT